ncbi:hypothetical protein PF005_g24230 [Phytophthora fragariae]|uniref:Uncharacterized protein n=1 Tax=Phytophthora fragariae TaxID=53985 RepID=A0A6A3IFW1_9STRA|nr:hypothetical protein PF003_g18860 [Phytophthora fragariae]KAE8979395.1 hypothetical protein PF011_g22868 [Phytophthora fragariae]KAE9178079.1 hypothetical protein PF005_g24230 [Phytophthora fragariae]KAE9217914.1 hypothetical protein PF004_g14015 [Phytophthora fragariae]KAE9331372.1 hypothetical protein PF008_g15462 [Phytophthora fragariae]
MIGRDTGGSSCVSQEYNRTCTATEKMQATTADANTSTAATTASAGTPALLAPSLLSVMDRELKPWGLYD